MKLENLFLNSLKLLSLYFQGSFKYFSEFSKPFLRLSEIFFDVESKKILNKNPVEIYSDYLGLFLFNLETARREWESGILKFNKFYFSELIKCYDSLWKSIKSNDDNFEKHLQDKIVLLEKILNEYPAKIKNIKNEFGFHFEDDGYLKIAETDRFILYRVLPDHSQIKTDEKPILIIPPHVLGHNILCFLSSEKKSYVHAFAREGIPTYVRVLKDINENTHVQTMTIEDDVLDTEIFCDIIKKQHNKMVTLNGYCQGGFIALLNVLSGTLDSIVDALILCASPVDGTKSSSFNEYINRLPHGFRDLSYSVKKLPNGNEVVDGTILSLVYKLLSIEKDSWLNSLLRDIQIVEKAEFKKIVLALNFWLKYEVRDLPYHIIRVSFDSYTKPISKDGTLPVKIFGNSLNLNRIKEKNIKMQICHAEDDNLVEKESALAPKDYIDAEICQFPDGHISIATQWADPSSKFAINKRFNDKMRGHVRFQLDLNAK